MRTKHLSCKISIPGELLLYLALILLLFPLRLVLAMLLAAVVHEAFHIMAIRAFGLGIYDIQVGFLGAKIRTESMTPAQELVCALAGPLGGFTILLFFRWFPLTALCAFVQSLYNLIPIYPSDGGRALRCCIGRILPDRIGDGLYNIIEWVFIISFVILGVYATIVLNLGIVPICIAMILFIRKIPCKLSRHRIQ